MANNFASSFAAPHKNTIANKLNEVRCKGGLCSCALCRVLYLSRLFDNDIFFVVFVAVVSFHAHRDPRLTIQSNPITLLTLYPFGWCCCCLSIHGAHSLSTPFAMMNIDFDDRNYFRKAMSFAPLLLMVLLLLSLIHSLYFIYLFKSMLIYIFVA